MAESADDLPRPTAAQMERRPESVDSLFTATMIGIKDSAPKNVSSLLKDAGNNHSWSTIYEQAKGQLEHQTGDDKKGAQAKIMMEQLEKLNKMAPSERSAYIQGLSSTDKSIDGINKVQDDVRGKLMYSRPDAIGKQRDAVNLADQMNTPALQSEANSIKDAMSHNPDSKQAVFLNKELDLARAAMAAPFTERARLAAIQLQDGRAVQAEHTLDDALKATVPKDAWSTAWLSQLRNDATNKRDELHVENNLLELFDQSVARLSKITGRQDINKTDFNAQCLKDPQFGALSKFLSSHYDTLTKNHNFMSSKGITRSDVQNYVNERRKHLNDFVD